MEEDVPSPHSACTHPSSPTPQPPSFTTPTSPPPPAHTIIRLIQCSQCSLPLRAPLRLPCGNSVCRACLPEVRARTGITYPASEERKEGFTCYWDGIDRDCFGEHCLGDCGSDVLLSRLVDVFEEVLGAGGLGGSGDESPRNVQENNIGEWEGRVEGDLRHLYSLAKHGQLGDGAADYEDDVWEVDDGTFGKLKEAVRNELDCHVCYSAILDPLTTSCGHTFCRGCVALVMKHSDLCPVCRRKLNMDLTVQTEPTNKRISGIMDTLFPEQVASRREAAQEPAGTVGDETTTLPLFVSSLSLPTVPTFLHVFEPRYRLMMRRVMRRRGHKFGMVMLNRGRRSQGELGRTHFMQYGTVVKVDRYELLPDGRSLVIATGVSRFKVLSSDIVDGYTVGRVQRVNDISIMEEERRESMETMPVIADMPSPETDSSDKEKPLDSMSTQQLFHLGQAFVQKQHSQGAAWLHPRVLLAYGAIPEDAAKFPWWFASVLPVWEEEKYELLPTHSVRERLKITARWVKKLESQEWLTRSRPSIASVL